MKTRLAMISAAAMLGLLVAVPAQAEDTLVIGGISDLSAFGAVWGKAMQGALKMVEQETNSSGGLKVGDKVYTIKTIMYDNASQSAKSVAAANRLVDEDNAKFVLGPDTAASAIATKPIFEENRVINFVVGAYSRNVLAAPVKYLFRAASTPVEYIHPMLTWLRDHGPKDIKRVVTINPNDEAGWDMQATEVDSYPKYGYEIVGTELYERSTKDFQPILTSLLAKKPDLIEMGGSPPASTGLIVRQAREMGYKGRFIKIGGPGPKEILAAAGKEAAEGVIQYIPADPNGSGYQRLATAFKQQNGYDMDSTLISSYDAVRMMLAAVQKAGTLDADKVAAAVPEIMPFTSVLGGKIKLTGKDTYGADHQMITPAYVGVITDGALKITPIEQ